MKRAILALAGAACAVGLLLAPAASAAEFGDNCTANETAEEFPYVLFEAQAAADPLPIFAPGAGVITSWKVDSAVPGSHPLNLKVLRLQGFTAAEKSKGTATVVGESSGTVQTGANVFPARIPVQPSDAIGISGPGGILYCETSDSTLFGFAIGSVGTVPFLVQAGNVRVPVSAVVEPDLDGDGYGDVTQDGCPQSAAFHTACPLVAIGAVDVVAKGAVTVILSTDQLAPVQVVATVKVGKGKPTKLSAAGQTVAPGGLAKFKLAFPAKLKQRLKELTPKQSLKLAITAFATNVVGVPSSAQSNVKLKGLAK